LTGERHEKQQKKKEHPEKAGKYQWRTNVGNWGWGLWGGQHAGHARGKEGLNAEQAEAQQGTGGR